MAKFRDVAIMAAEQADLFESDDAFRVPTTAERAATSGWKSISTAEMMSLSSKDFMDLSKDDLRIIIRKAADTANHRIDAIHKAAGGQDSPATRYVAEHGGRFGLTGLDELEDYRTEYKRIKHFLEAKTSSVSEWRKLADAISGKLSERGIAIPAGDDLGGFAANWSEARAVTQDLIAGGKILAEEQEIKYVEARIKQLLDSNDRRPPGQQRSVAEIARAAARAADAIYRNQQRSISTIVGDDDDDDDDEEGSYL